MAENIGDIHIEADLDKISRREAAAIQTLESKLLGYTPQGGLAAAAQSAAAEHEGLSTPMERGRTMPHAADIDVDKGRARADFGHLRMEVDLNRVRPEEAAALQAAEAKLEGYVPSGGIAATAQSMAKFNQELESVGEFHPGITAATPRPEPVQYYQEVVVQPPPVVCYVPMTPEAIAQQQALAAQQQSGVPSQGQQGGQGWQNQPQQQGQRQTESKLTGVNNNGDLRD